MIEANRYWKKSIVEKSNEAKAQQARKPKSVQKNSSEQKPIETREEVAKAVGVSFDTLKKIEVIIEENPKAVADFDVGKKTVDDAYSQIKREALGHILEMHPRAENTTYVMLCG
ncbi:MAG: hypothetical protein GY941_30445 [Planctomycetes bacterium]|nr:hypothetical protein [Planctomycetota bacterium]